jgi:hypothetical protein
VLTVCGVVAPCVRSFGGVLFAFGVAFALVVSLCSFVSMPTVAGSHTVRAGVFCICVVPFLTSMLARPVSYRRARTFTQLGIEMTIWLNVK